MKRGSVWLWLLLLVASGVADWGPALRAQEIDKPLIDDVSKQVPKAVTTLPEAASRVPAPLVAAQAPKQIMLELLLVELDLDQLPVVKDEKSKRERLASWASKFGWSEQHRGVDWKAKQGLDQKLFGGENSKLGKVLAAPSLIVLEGSEASFLSGGELPVIDLDQPDKKVEFRPFGLSMKCVATTRRSGLVRLDLKLENTQRAAASESSATQATIAALSELLGAKKAEDSTLIVGQTISLIADIPNGESYVMALPSDKDPANKVVLVSVTPQEFAAPNGVAKDSPQALPSPAPHAVTQATGKGINSDAGVRGDIVQEGKSASHEWLKLEVKTWRLPIDDSVRTGKSESVIEKFLSQQGIKLPATIANGTRLPFLMKLDQPLWTESKGVRGVPAELESSLFGPNSSRSTARTRNGHEVTLNSAFGGSTEPPHLPLRDGWRLKLTPTVSKAGRLTLKIESFDFDATRPNFERLKKQEVVTREPHDLNDSFLFLNGTDDSPPTLMAQVQVDVVPQARPDAELKAVTGKGINSDAGVTGSIVLADKATQATLRAESLSIEVPKLQMLFGSKVGQRGLLVRQQMLVNADLQFEIVAQPLMLEAIKNPDSQHKHRADVTLRAESQQAAEQLSAVRQPSTKHELLVFLPMPEGVQQVAPADLQRLIEHASIRTEAADVRNPSPQDAFELIEVAAGQKSVRVPINRMIFALLQTPTGNQSKYVGVLTSDRRGIKQIAGLTVFFVTEAAIELEALIKETEPEANVTVIEVKESALLRGSVSSAEQRKAIVELAEQFYPKVLDQLRVGKTVTYEKIGIDFENGQKPITTVTTVTERTEPLLPVGWDSIPTRSQAEGEKSGSSSNHQPQKNGSGRIPNLRQAEEVEALASGAKRLKKQAPQKLPSVEKLKELRDDVKGLRRDVQRLNELLEREREERRMATPGRQPESEQGVSVTSETELPKTTAKSGHPPADTPDVTIDASKGTSSRASKLAFLSRAGERVKLAPTDGFTIALNAGEAEEVTLGRSITRVNGFDETKLDVKPLAPDRLQLTGKKAGCTVLQVDFDDQQTQTLSVVVANQVSIDVDDQPLREVIKTLATQAGINIRIDLAALEEEGVAPTAPVSATLTNISGWEALRSVLSPLNLVMHLDGEIIVVSSAVRAQGQPVTAVYPVADLVVPVTGTALDAPYQKPVTKESSQALIELLQATIQPGSWSKAGGNGSIEFAESSLSLVIRQTPAVHEEIRDLLGQLRRLQDKQVVLESQFISTPEANLPAMCRGENPQRSLVLSVTDTQHYRDQWQQDRRSNLIIAPKVTLLNGQAAIINGEKLGLHPMSLLLRGTASGDQSSVALSLGINGESFETATRRHSEKLQVGQSLLLDVTEDMQSAATLLKKLPIAADSDEARNILKKLQTKKGERLLLLVTPSIHVVEEEEQKLGIEAR